MSRAFLDSHVAFWIARGSHELSSLVVASINRHTQRSISALTFTEFEMKSRFRAGFDLIAFKRDLDSHYIAIEPYGVDAALTVTRFPSLANHDPFDRMIFAQAASRPNTTFYTADRKLLELGLDWVVDARG